MVTARVPLLAEDEGRVVQRLVTGARESGLRGILGVIGSVLDTSCVVFDASGNVLAAHPERTLWDFLETSRGPGASDADSSVWAEWVDVDGDRVALLAVATSNPPQWLSASATAVVALEVARLRARVEGRRELAGQVFEDVISARTTESEALNRFASLGLDIGQPFRVIVQHGGARGGRLRDDLGLNLSVAGGTESVVRVNRGDHLVVVVPEGPVILTLARNLARYDDAEKPSIAVGVSGVHTGSTGLRVAYYEATVAAEEGPGVHNPHRVSMGRLVLTMTSGQNLEETAREYLAPLGGTGRQSDATLRETLVAYLTTNRSIAATAEALFVHRNTLRYRLSHIEDRLGISLEDTDDLVDVWLALRLSGQNGDIAEAQRSVSGPGGDVS